MPRFRHSLASVLLTFGLLAGCASTSTESQLISDAPVEFERLALMMDVPDAEMKESFVATLRGTLSAAGIEVVELRPSRDPRPERIAEYGAEASAGAVLYAGTTSMSIRDETVSSFNINEKEAGSRSYEIALTLYGVEAQRRVWTASTTTTRKGNDSDAGAAMGEEIARSTLAALRRDGLLDD